MRQPTRRVANNGQSRLKLVHQLRHGLQYNTMHKFNVVFGHRASAVSRFCYVFIAVLLDSTLNM